MAYLEVLIGAVTSFLVGFAWYTVLFGKTWQEESGITAEQAQANMGRTHGLAFLMMCVIAMVSNMYFNFHDVAEQTFVHGAFHGGMTALCFAVPAVAIHYLYQRKSLKLFLIDAGYIVVFFALSTAVMGALKLG